MEEKDWDHNPNSMAIVGGHESIVEQSQLLRDLVKNDRLERDKLNRLFAVEIDTLTEPERLRVLEAQAAAVELVYNLASMPNTPIMALINMHLREPFTIEELKQFAPTASLLLENRHFAAHLWNNNEKFFSKYFKFVVDQRYRDDSDLTLEESFQKKISKYVRDLSAIFVLADPITGKLSQTWKNYLIEG